LAGVSMLPYNFVGVILVAPLRSDGSAPRFWREFRRH
jgi:hypothetical protein